jgi:sugar lactone lactonase YvrE
VWQPALGLLFWIDASTGSLFSYNPAVGKAANVPTEDKVSACAACADESILLLGNKLSFLQNGKALTVELPWRSGAQLDAVTVDRQGRLVCAVRLTESKSSQLCWIQANGRMGEVLTNVGRVSSLAFDPPGSFLYCCHAGSREVARFEYNSETSRASARDVIAVIPASLGTSNGLAVDAKGFLWVAIWGGSCVLRMSPAGKEDQRIYFTAGLLSGLAFGGKELRDLYVVSSGAQDRKANGPGAGALFRLRPGVRGAATSLVQRQLLY